MWSNADREVMFADSPFAPYARKEGFGLWAVKSSYTLLSSITRIDESYYEIAEELAKAFPKFAEALYNILRKGMDEDEKNHINILYAITSVTTFTTE